MIGLPPIVVVATLGVAWFAGLWVIASIYFYWQWRHYTRQSWGISRACRGKDPSARYDDVWLDQAIFYAIPVFRIIARSAAQPPTFIGMELWSVPVPPVLATVSGYIAFALLAVWLAGRARAAAEGRLAIVRTMYMLTHLAIFFLAYIGTSDITPGWLMINI